MDKVNQYYAHRSFALPSFRSIEIQQFNLQAIIKPTGIRRIVRCLPYVTGSNVVFNLILKTLRGDTREFSHECKLYFVSSDRNVKQVSHDEVLIEQDRNIIHTKISTWIATPGHYSLELTYHYHGMKRTEPMAEFTAQSKDLLITDWIIRFFFLIIGGLIGYLVNNAFK